VKLTLAIPRCYARSVSAVTLHDLLRQIHAQPATSWTREDKRVLMDIVRKLLRETTEAPPYHKHTREDEVFMLIKGAALLWCDDQEMELSEGGIVFLPKDIPHAYRITSKKADLLMINTPAGIEGMFRYAGRDRATPRPDGFEISAERMAAGADKFGQIILGPPR
jgi:mannose-6-phosphate isomerase-like protein (cupin superfamily)